MIGAQELNIHLGQIKKIDDAEKLTKDGETYYQVELEKFLRDEKKVYSADGELRDDVSYWN